MQVTRHFSGVFNSGSTKAFHYAYGSSSTTSLYEGVVEELNQIVADFLANDCGIEGVVYEARGTDTQKYIWIFDSPILFLYAVSSNIPYVVMYMPYANNVLINTSTSTRLAVSTSDWTYSFYLYFSGNAKSGGLLRFSTYAGSVPIAAGSFFINKLLNICTGKDAVYVSCPAFFTLTTYMGYKYIWDTDENDEVLITKGFAFNTLLNTANNAWNFGEKYPLIPLYVGPYKFLNLYYFVANNASGFRPPDGNRLTVEVQTEFSLDGRQFISYYFTNFGAATSTASGASFASMGLQEVTET